VANPNHTVPASTLTSARNGLTQLHVPVLSLPIESTGFLRAQMSCDTPIDETAGDFDRHFKIVEDGAERTRGILYFFCLVLIVNIVFFYEDAFNTAGSRLYFMSGANACLGKPLEPQEPVPLSAFTENCGYFYNYISKYYQINIPTVNVAGMDDQAKFAFKEKYKVLLKDDSDSNSTNVPLLNIRIDRNTGLILQNSMGVIILFVLLLSLEAEVMALVSIGKLTRDDRIKAKAVVDTHIFSRLSAGRAFLVYGVFAPALMQSFRILQDLSQARIVFMLYGTLAGSFYLLSEVVSCGMVTFVAWRCFRKAKELNSVLGSFEQNSSSPIR
jgi:hypothetical protein